MQFLRKIAFPFSLVYAMVVYIRNFLYDQGILSSKTYKTPTICVGNLSIGGTGKTPMIELLIEMLQTRKIAVLSRGYRRRTRGFIMVSPESSAEEVGDEPLQIYIKHPKVDVAVDENRQRGISNLELGINPDLILLDDAFQHRKVRAKFSILLTSYDKLYTDDWYLPTGNLRDSKRQARRADTIIVTKCPDNLSETERSRIIDKIRPKASQDVLFSALVYANKLKGFNDGIRLSALKHKKITLVTGIANPQPLVTYLQGIGLEFEHLAFNDHHFFTKKEIRLLKSKTLVLTTEKDYIRSKEQINELNYIEVKHKLLGNGHEVLMRRLNRVLGS